MADQNQNPPPGPVTPTGVKGEESAPVTTLALGEEHTVTNLVGEQPLFHADFAAVAPAANTSPTGTVGEVGNPFAFAVTGAAAPPVSTTPITTNVAGEEGPTILPAGAEGPPTHFVNGAEAPTTSAIGEEGVTTFIFGEEGPTFFQAGAEGPPTQIVPGLEAPTTSTIGEEGPTTFIFGEEGPTFFQAGAEGPPTHIVPGLETPTTSTIGEEGPTTFIFGEEGPTFLQAGAEGPPTQIVPGLEAPTTWTVGEEGPTTFTFGEEGPPTSPSNLEGPPTATMIGAEGPTILPPGAENPPVFAATPTPFGAAANSPFGAFSSAPTLGDLSSLSATPSALVDLLNRISQGVAATLSLRAKLGISIQAGAAIDIEQLRQASVISTGEAAALQLHIAEPPDTSVQPALRFQNAKFAALSSQSASPFAKFFLQSVSAIPTDSPSPFQPLARAAGGPGGPNGAQGAGAATVAGGIAGAVAGGPVGALIGAAAGFTGFVLGATIYGAIFGGGCFSSDTLVLMADGSARQISQLNIGDEIWTVSENEHLTRDMPAGARATIEAVHHHDGSHQLFDVGGLLVTAVHPWAARVGGVPGFVKTLELDDRLELRVCSLVDTGMQRAPKPVPRNERASKVFNLKTSARTFAVSHSADGPFFVVHNKKDDKTGEELPDTEQ